MNIIHVIVFLIFYLKFSATNECEDYFNIISEVFAKNGQQIPGSKKNIKDLGYYCEFSYFQCHY